MIYIGIFYLTSSPISNATHTRQVILFEISLNQLEGRGKGHIVVYAQKMWNNLPPKVRVGIKRSHFYPWWWYHETNDPTGDYHQTAPCCQAAAHIRMFSRRHVL